MKDDPYPYNIPPTLQVTVRAMRVVKTSNDMIDTTDYNKQQFNAIYTAAQFQITQTTKYFYTPTLFNKVALIENEFRTIGKFVNDSAESVLDAQVYFFTVNDQTAIDISSQLTCLVEGVSMQLSDLFQAFFVRLSLVPADTTIYEENIPVYYQTTHTFTIQLDCVLSNGFQYAYIDLGIGQLKDELRKNSKYVYLVHKIPDNVLELFIKAYFIGSQQDQLLTHLKENKKDKQIGSHTHGLTLLERTGFFQGLVTNLEYFKHDIIGQFMQDDAQTSEHQIQLYKNNKDSVYDSTVAQKIQTLANASTDLMLFFLKVVYDQPITPIQKQEVIKSVLYLATAGQILPALYTQGPLQTAIAMGAYASLDHYLQPSDIVDIIYSDLIIPVSKHTMNYFNISPENQEYSLQTFDQSIPVTKQLFNMALYLAIQGQMQQMLGIIPILFPNQAENLAAVSALLTNHDGNVQLGYNAGDFFQNVQDFMFRGDYMHAQQIVNQNNWNIQHNGQSLSLSDFLASIAGQGVNQQQLDRIIQQNRQIFQNLPEYMFAVSQNPILRGNDNNLLIQRAVNNIIRQSRQTNFADADSVNQFLSQVNRLHGLDQDVFSNLFDSVVQQNQVQFQSDPSFYKYSAFLIASLITSYGLYSVLSDYKTKPTQRIDDEVQQQLQDNKKAPSQKFMMLNSLFVPDKNGITGFQKIQQTVDQMNNQHNTLFNSSQYRKRRREMQYDRYYNWAKRILDEDDSEEEDIWKTRKQQIKRRHRQTSYLQKRRKLN